MNYTSSMICSTGQAKLWFQNTKHSFQYNEFPQSLMKEMFENFYALQNWFK